MRRTLAVIAMVAMIVLSGYAQDPVMKANIPFSFMAGMKTLPAGNYEFTATRDRGTISIHNLDAKTVVDVLVMTRLAPESKAAERGRITFDEVNGTAHIEAIWPGADDGYLVGMAKEKHGHRTVKAE